MPPTFIMPESVSGFHDYFRLTPDSDEVARQFGYTFELKRAVPPRYAQPIPWALALQRRMERSRLHVRLTSEIARREYFIAPILLEIVAHFDVQLRSEYTVNVSEQLRGNIDYFIESKRQFLIVEAKNEDLVRGTSQLVAELAAMDVVTENTTQTLYGAVSTGTLWQFVALHRMEKRFVQDLTLYRVPDEVPDLCAILLGILQPKEATQAAGEDAPDSEL